MKKNIMSKIEKEESSILPCPNPMSIQDALGSKPQRRAGSGIGMGFLLSEGWSDEETLQILRETTLFKASSRCYGPEAETFEGGFDEVLPLRQEKLDLPTLRNMGSCVETILMQHKDFPDAEKLMLTAVMLGIAKDDTRVEKDPSLME
ncbi:hypothetical protein F0562_011251 [Nyssa sinensis]|uniref:Uncharacterized protein n=1 Tax=Nyssa sinensis TaxID=561372 RepID=A0A5J5A4F3_9ASTE|nr:hypothetical protein F0562_011251 [Nyssa sinensis]